jgi:hypothetical protein
MPGGFSTTTPCTTAGSLHPTCLRFCCNDRLYGGNGNDYCDNVEDVRPAVSCTVRSPTRRR